MKKTIFLLFIIGSFFISLLSCGSNFQTKNLPEINWVFAGTNGGTSYQFTGIKPGKRGEVNLVIQNVGKKYLEISDIALADGENENQYITIEWPHSLKPEFPIYIRPHENVDNPGTLPEGVQSFQSYTITIVYQPGNTPDMNPAKLIIKSNDPENSEISMDITVGAPQPDIDIYPSVKQFISSSYECQDFSIYNKGGDDLIFQGVNLDKPSNRFKLKNWPDQGDVLAPGGTPLSFTLCYDPIDEENEQNFVNVYSNDPDENPFKVSVSCSPQPTLFEVSYEDEDKGYIDFTDVASGTATKKVIIRTLTETECNQMGKKCGGQLKLTDLNIISNIISDESVNAADAYSWVLQKPAAGAGQQPEVICTNETKAQKLQQQNFLVGVASGNSVEVVITYNADVYQQGMNAQLVVNHTVAGQDDIKIPIFGGVAKPVFDIMPQNFQLHFYTSAANEKVIDAVIYNNGNGPLKINSIKVISKFSEDPSKDFTLNDTSLENGVEVQPFSLIHIPVKFFYQSLEDSPEARLHINYVDSIVGELKIDINLYASVDLGIELPKAVQKQYSPINAKETITLDGTGSTGSQGASVAGYIWYIYEKPSGSKITLNSIEQTGKTSMTPDVPGTYKVGLIIYDSSTPLPHFSDPSFAEITVN